MFKTVVIGCALMMAQLAGASAQASAVVKERYLVFFAPRGTQLDPTGQEIVREAVAAMDERRPSKIEIVAPPKASGGADVVEARYTAIQNIISAFGVDAAICTRVKLTASATDLPGANDRAEIRLIP